MTLNDEYARLLSQLTGMPFQEEVCTKLSKVYLDFQPIPCKPRGDGALDGLSHDGEIAYCCYGTEYDSVKKPKDYAAAIVSKFQEDLRHLFELDTRGATLIHKENREIGTIVAAGTKIKHIRLIANWFESHRIIGPISTALKRYRRESTCKYVARDAGVTIWGPHEFAHNLGVDEECMARIQHGTLLSDVKSAAEAVNITDPTTFEAKIAALKGICPAWQESAIEGMRNQFLNDWRMSIAFEQKIDSRLPTLHKTLDDSRMRIAQRVCQLMISSPQPHTELAQAEKIASEVLAPEFDTFGATILAAISSGEIARLMGECLIAWEASSNV